MNGENFVAAVGYGIGAAIAIVLVVLFWNEATVFDPISWEVVPYYVIGGAFGYYQGRKD